MIPATVILDGDHGSDDFIATLILLGRPDLFDLKAIITTRGNVSARQAAKNAGLAIAVAGHQDTIPVYIGAEHPFSGPDQAGDDAFGQDGLGGVEFPEIAAAPPLDSGVDWLINFLETNSNVTLFVTGPLTTLAVALQKKPSIKNTLDAVVIMGGALNTQHPSNGATPRIGNITPYAEFNFYMDPHAADYVMQQDVPCVLYPLDVTHQLVFSPERQQLFREAIQSPYCNTLITMMRSAEIYDVPKFGASGAFFHDQHVIIGSIMPALYQGISTGLRVETNHQADNYGQLITDPTRPTKQVMTVLKDADAAFTKALHAIAQT